MNRIFDQTLSPRERAEALVAELTLSEKIEQLMDKAPAVERLGIKAFGWWNECLHGMARNGTATVFPQSIALSATFDPTLMRRVADAISDEVRGRYNDMRRLNVSGLYKGITVCAPNINLFRDPRWGRGQETYGEDPFLTAEMGVNFIQGLQGDDPEHRKLDCELKHFAVHSGPEELRHEIDVQIDDKQLFETYLYAFRECIRRADVSSVMGAYNRVNHMPCSGSSYLLRNILRDRLGFKGYVVSDSGAIDDFHLHHGVTASPVESAAMAFNNGCDLNIGSSYRYLGEAVERGLVREEDIDRSLVRLLMARIRLGMFDPEGTSPYDALDGDVVDCKAFRSLALEAARKCIVLLKNENGLLPLDPKARIAVIGPNADSRDVLLGNYNGTPSRYTTLLEGIRRRCADPDQVLYEEGCDLYKPRDPRCDADLIPVAVRAAVHSDIVVLCLGLAPRIEGEAGDAVKPDRETLGLPGRQAELFNAIAATGKPIVLVLSGGCAISIPDEDQLAGAVVHSWYPGQSGGEALAEVLFGDYNPAGRMPVTTVRRVEDLPPFGNYDMEGRTYRYIRREPLYPFGFGLSYTTFAYENLLFPNEISAGAPLEITLDVRNTGTRDGDEVIQLYLVDEAASVKTPIRQLAGIQRVFLARGEGRRVRFVLDPQQFAVTLPDGRRQIEPGWFTIEVGGTQGDEVSVRRSGARPMTGRLLVTGSTEVID